MQIFKPDMYYKDIYQIPYKTLKEKGIKCLLFDVDNTCVGYHEKKPTENLNNLFQKINKMDFKIILFSNATKKRLQPFHQLSVDIHPFSKKPFKKNFKKIIQKYHYQPQEICIIGDQILTDILGGNKVGIHTCLVEPLTKEDFIFTKLTRKIEKIILSKLERKNIFKKNGDFK